MIHNRISAATSPKKVMYHATRRTNLSSITKRGLVPAKTPNPASEGFQRQGNWVKNAIYFSSSLENAKEWVKLLTGRGFGDPIPTELREFVILEVNVGPWVKQFVADSAAGKADKRNKDWDGFHISGVTIPPTNIKRVIDVDNTIVSEILEKHSYDWMSFVNMLSSRTDAEIEEVVNLLSKPKRNKIRKKAEIVLNSGIRPDLKVDLEEVIDLMKTGKAPKRPWN